MADKYAQLVELLETQGVLQFDGDWAEPIIAFVKKNKPKRNTRAQLPSQGGEAVAWRVTGRDGLTVTGQYPKWAEADCLLTITPLYTSLSTTTPDSRVVPVELLEVCVKRWSILANEFITGSPSYEEEQLKIGKLRALLEVKP